MDRVLFKKGTLLLHFLRSPPVKSKEGYTFGSLAEQMQNTIKT